MFYDNLALVCQQKDVKIATVVKECGGAVGSIDGWKKGAIPRSDIVAKLSLRLNVTTDFLLFGNSANIISTSVTESDKTVTTLSQKEQQLLAAYKAHPELQLAVDKLLDIDDEEIYRAAHSKSNHPGEIRKLTKEEKERFDKAEPVTSDTEDF